MGRLIDQIGDDTLPARSRDAMRASTATYVQSVIEEYIHTSASPQAAAALADFGDSPE